MHRCMAKVLDIPDLLTEHEYTVLKKLVFFCSLDEQHVSRESDTAATPAMNIMHRSPYLPAIVVSFFSWSFHQYHFFDGGVIVRIYFFL